VKTLLYADDITVYATGPSIPILETQINSYLTTLSESLRNHNLRLSIQKSFVTLFTSDSHQSRLHPSITINNQPLPLNKTPKLLGVTFDTFMAFHHHAKSIQEKMLRRNTILKALTGTSWGQQKELLSITYKALARSLANYAAPVWYPFASATSFRRLQVAQNAALRIITGNTKMAPIHHLHEEAKILPRLPHSKLLAAQFLYSCKSPDHPCHPILELPPPPRKIKPALPESLLTFVNNFRSPTPKESLRKIHTSIVSTYFDSAPLNKVSHLRKAPPIHHSEASLPRADRTLLSQLRSGYCSLLRDHQSRVHPDTRLAAAAAASCQSRSTTCSHAPASPPTSLPSPSGLWTNPTQAITHARSYTSS
jgi:hypothetical protein